MHKVVILVIFIVFALSACGKPSYLQTSNYYHPTLKDGDVDHPLGWKRYYLDMMQCQNLSEMRRPEFILGQTSARKDGKFNKEVKDCMESKGYVYKHE